MNTRTKKNKELRKQVRGEILKELGKKLIKDFGRNTIYIIVGLVYAIYLVLKAFNNFIAKVFMKMPRIIRILIIYILVLNLAINIIGVVNHKKNVVEELKGTLEIVSDAKIEVSSAEKKKLCLFDSVSCKIAETGEKIGLNEEQVLISIAISKWETGTYTSEAFHKKNNVGGMMCNNSLIAYASLDDGINAFVNNLKNNYFDIGLNTLEKIQPKYCPIGAANDPKGLNKHWLSGTNRMLSELKGGK